MTMRDLANQPVSGATAAAIEAFEQACHELRCYIGDPVASVDRAIAAGAGNCAFNDWHAMMAFVGAGRDTAQRAVLESLQVTARAGSGDSALFAREVGLDAERAARRPRSPLNQMFLARTEPARTTPSPCFDFQVR